MDNRSSIRYYRFQQELLKLEQGRIFSYIRNASLGVSDAEYYDMCEALGSEPDEDEIPVNFEDLLYESQQAIILYNYLVDVWAGGMSAFYIGKNLSNIEYIFDIHNIEEESRLYILEFILLIDKENANTINGKLSKQSESKHGK